LHTFKLADFSEDSEREVCFIEQTGFV